MRTNGFVFSLGPPRSLHRQPSNLTIMPASLLRHKDQWQRMANNLPTGDILIFLPRSDTPLKKVLEIVAHLLEAEGHRVIISSADRFS